MPRLRDILGTMLLRIAAGVLVAASLAVWGPVARADSTTIRAAVERSPKTYFAYRSPLWWGQRVRIEIVRISTDDGFALAQIRVLAGPPSYRTQWALVQHQGTGWKVVSVALQHRSDLQCGSTPHAVLQRLAGGCSKYSLWPAGVVSGPRAVRPPTSVERAALVQAAQTSVFAGRDRCVRYHVSVSTLDQRYASVSYTFVKPYTHCSPADGVSIFHRASDGWGYAGGASDGFPCTQAPPGVARSLFGDCLFG